MSTLNQAPGKKVPYEKMVPTKFRGKFDIMHDASFSARKFLIFEFSILEIQFWHSTYSERIIFDIQNSKLSNEGVPTKLRPTVTARIKA